MAKQFINLSPVDVVALESDIRYDLGNAQSGEWAFAWQTGDSEYQYDFVSAGYNDVLGKWTFNSVDGEHSYTVTGAEDAVSLSFAAKDLQDDWQVVVATRLADRSVLKVTLNAANTVIALPALTSGKVSDFGIDMVNAYTPEVDGTPTPTAASFQLYGTLGTDYNLVVPKGETWSDMTALAPNEMAVYYFTLSAFAIGNLPTWEVMKKVVELVPVPVAP